MIASVYIKNGNIHFYNERNDHSNIGGIAYELGRPLLDFVCYEQERFDEAFTMIASAYDNDLAYTAVNDPEYTSGVKENLTEMQKREAYVYFYNQMLMKFVSDFVLSPRKAIAEIESKLPGAEEKLAWAMDFEWPATTSDYLSPIYRDKEKRLYRAAMDVVSLMAEHLRKFQTLVTQEIEVLLHYRSEIQVPDNRPIDYVDILDEWHMMQYDTTFYLEKPFNTFYGRVATQEVEQLYEIDKIEDLFRFEFIKMIEHGVFIKKCKNCEQFFIPRRRADAEYCERIYGDGPRRCSEIGAMLRYEKKVAENPILEAHKKAYRRFNSRVRTKKMTQNEFRLWSDEAAKKRDECMAGTLSFEEFVAWLEQGRLRKSRG